MAETDHDITIPWPLLVGDLSRFVASAVTEHEAIALQAEELSDKEKEKKHLLTVRLLNRWLHDRPTDTMMALCLLGADAKVIERAMIGMHHVRAADAKRYAKRLVEEGQVLVHERGPAPEQRKDFCFHVDDSAPIIYVTKRLLTLVRCAGEVPVKMLGREQLERLVAEYRHPLA